MFTISFPLQNNFLLVFWIVRLTKMFQSYRLSNWSRR